MQISGVKIYYIPRNELIILHIKTNKKSYETLQMSWAVHILIPTKTFLNNRLHVRVQINIIIVRFKSMISESIASKMHC